MSEVNAKGPQIQYDLWKLAQLKWTRDAIKTVDEVLKGDELELYSSGEEYLESLSQDKFDKTTGPKSGFLDEKTARNIKNNRDETPIARQKHYHADTQKPPPQQREALNDEKFRNISRLIKDNPGYTNTAILSQGIYRPPDVEKKRDSYYDTKMRDGPMIQKKSKDQGVLMNMLDAVMDFVSTLLG